MYIAKVYVTLKESVLDPQGQAVVHALHELNHKEVSDIRVGKYIEVKLSADDISHAEKLTKEYCEVLLANPVIETYRYEVGMSK